MTTSRNNNGISTRLRVLIQRKFDKRRKFFLLEQKSGIAASKWKNFYYQKQDASKEMLSFWIASFPEDGQFLANGFVDVSNPFSIDFPNLEQRTSLKDRLNWVISDWCAHTGTKIFKYLEEKCSKKITAIDWLDMVIGKKAPSVEMVQFICNTRPHFCAWIMNGKVTPQVDPTSEQSVKEWVVQKNL